jgi:hypothetical protein
VPDADTRIDTEDAIPLAVPHFEEQLLLRLHERQQAGAWSAPSRRSSIGFDHGGWWRGPRGRLVAAAAAVALVGGASAVLLTRDGDGPDLGTAATVPEGPRDPVLDQVAAALGTVIDDGGIVHITTDDGTNEAWVDLRSKAERSIIPATSGGRTMDWGRSEPPALDGERPPIEDPVPRRLVDHCRHEYADRVELDLQMFDVVTPLAEGLAVSDYEVSGPVDVDGRDLLVLTPLPPRATSDSNEAAEEALAEIQAELEAGGNTPAEALAEIQAELEAEGHTPAEATALEEARADLEAQVQADIDAEAADPALHEGGIIYVDPATNLPVHLGQAGSGEGKDIEYLPRTAENLALLVPPVPDGYTAVDQLALDEVRAAGCVG